MIKFDDNENRIERLFGRLATIEEDLDEDNQDDIIEFDMSEYDIIESIKGILFLNTHMFFFNLSNQSTLCA
jgi:hypothetical protein